MKGKSMTKENETPVFASDVASAYWDSVKAENGDAVDVNAIVGTGTNGAIKKGDVDTYLEALTDTIDEKLDDEPDANAPAPQDGEIVDGEPQGDDLEPHTGDETEGDTGAPDDAENQPSAIDGDLGEHENALDGENEATTQSIADGTTDDEPDDDDDALNGISLVNLTKNTFKIEGVLIEPEGRVEYTDELKNSERCKHAIETGVLEVE